MFKLVVLSVAFAVASASPVSIWGGLAGPWNPALVAPLAGPIAAPFAAVAPIGAYNYRGPLSLAPGQPATILAADGRPLDTLSVNLDRAVHNTAQAVERRGRISKRSIVDASLIANPVAAAQWTGAGVLAAPVAGTPLAAAQWSAGGVVAAPFATAQLTGAGVVASPFAAPALALSPSATLNISGARVVASAPVAIAAGSPVAPVGFAQLG